MLKTTDFFQPRFHLFSNVKSVIYLWWFNISSLLLLKRKGTRLFKPLFYLSMKRMPFYLSLNSKSVNVFFYINIVPLKKKWHHIFRPRFSLYVNRRLFCFQTAYVWFFWMVFLDTNRVALKEKIGAYSNINFIRTFRPFTSTADYPHRLIFANRRKKNQLIIRTGGWPAHKNKIKLCKIVLELTNLKR